MVDAVRGAAFGLQSADFVKTLSGGWSAGVIAEIVTLFHSAVLYQPGGLCLNMCRKAEQSHGCGQQEQKLPDFLFSFHMMHSFLLKSNGLNILPNSAFPVNRI